MGEGGFCYYRLNGLKCVVGHFIPDFLYDSKLEGNTVDFLPQEVLDVMGFSENNMELAKDLQSIHDLRHPYEWEECLKELAEEYGLEMSQSAS